MTPTNILKSLAYSTYFVKMLPNYTNLVKFFQNFTNFVKYFPTSTTFVKLFAASTNLNVDFTWSTCHVRFENLTFLKVLYITTTSLSVRYLKCFCITTSYLQRPWFSGPKSDLYIQVRLYVRILALVGKGAIRCIYTSICCLFCFLFRDYFFVMHIDYWVDICHAAITYFRNVLVEHFMISMVVWKMFLN